MAEPAQQPVKPGMSNQKKWMIGCGGCLLFVIVLVVVLLIGGAYLWKDFSQKSDQTVQEVLGGTPPAGYATIGFSLPGGGSRMIMMVQPDTQRFIMALEFPIPAAQAEIIRSGSQEQIQTLVDQFLQQHASRMENADIQDVRFEGIRAIKLPNGKTFTVVNVKTRNKENAYSPAVAALLPRAGNELTLLFAMDPITLDSSPEADFSAKYAMLTAELQQLVTGTALDDRLAAPQG